MADEKVKTRHDIEQETFCETPKNEAVDAFEAKAKESDEFLEIARAEVDYTISDDSETYNRQLRQQIGE